MASQIPCVIPTSNHGRQFSTREGEHQDALTMGRASSQRVKCGQCHTTMEFDRDMNGVTLQRCRCLNAQWRVLPRLKDPNPEPPAKPVGRPKKDPLQILAEALERRRARAAA